MHHSERLPLRTKGFCDIRDITDGVLGIRERSSVTEGLLTIFCPGSTGALTTIEYESGALRDLERAIERLVPADDHYEHDERWGDGNGFSHVRAALMKPSLTISSISTTARATVNW
jgi:secondary thiamine-phosphate synthase enzyme